MARKVPRRNEDSWCSITLDGRALGWSAESATMRGTKELRRRRYLDRIKMPKSSDTLDINLGNDKGGCGNERYVRSLMPATWKLEVRGTCGRFADRFQPTDSSFSGFDLERIRLFGENFRFRFFPPVVDCSIDGLWFRKRDDIYRAVTKRARKRNRKVHDDPMRQGSFAISARIAIDRATRR